MKLNDDFARAFLMPWEESFFGALVQLIKCVHKFRKNPVRDSEMRCSRLQDRPPAPKERRRESFGDDFSPLTHSLGSYARHHWTDDADAKSGVGNGFAVMRLSSPLLSPSLPPEICSRLSQFGGLDVSLDPSRDTRKSHKSASNKR